MVGGEPSFVLVRRGNAFFVGGAIHGDRGVLGVDRAVLSGNFISATVSEWVSVLIAMSIGVVEKLHEMSIWA